MKTVTICGHEWRPLPNVDENGTRYVKAVLPIVRFLWWDEGKKLPLAGSFALPVIRGSFTDEDVAELTLRYPVGTDLECPANAREGIFWDRLGTEKAGTIVGHSVDILVHERVNGKKVGWQVVPYVAVWNGRGIQHARAANPGDGVLGKEDLGKALYDWWYECQRTFPIGEGLALVDQEGKARTGELLVQEATT